MTIPDQAQREQAIDPRHSYIVQAPAGSGKTALLTQRFLNLLAHSPTPESIIAITFTRKAAAEMKHRILSALQTALADTPPTNAHEAKTQALAKAALKRNETEQWQLLENAHRLRIMTIDALCGQLARQRPLDSGISQDTRLITDPSIYYAEAAESLIRGTDTPPVIREAVTTLLRHLDNRAGLLHGLLIDILSKREQWLPFIFSHQKAKGPLAAQLNEALFAIHQQQHTAITACLNPSEQALISTLVLHASAHQVPPLLPAELSAIQTVGSVAYWRYAANCLLNRQGEPRKRWDKRQGFLPAHRTMKAAALHSVESLADTGALPLLHAVQSGPPTEYPEASLTILNALITLLPYLAATLAVSFERQRGIDFIGLNLAALQVLGTSDTPSEVALQLDYQIHHLLIDEFQDTSRLQYQLIHTLLAGWTPGDNKTLFMVGDPMQSIYRFRNAEVGLFGDIIASGINQIKPIPLKLTANFRASAEIINWVNTQFKRLFNAPTHPLVAPIQCIPSQAMRNQEHSTVAWHLTPAHDPAEGTRAIVETLTHLLATHPEDTLAILVQSRGQLKTLIPALKAHNIPFEGVDLDPLITQACIQNIHILTTLLLHPEDRIAWLALLRSPLVGLTLEDLFAVAHVKHPPLYARLCAFDTIETLSTAGRTRLHYVMPILQHALGNIERDTLAWSVKSLWNDLHGPATLGTAEEYDAIDRYTDLLMALKRSGEPVTQRSIEKALARLFASTCPQRLHIMTIHKSKGLEFDHVLLPGLNDTTAHDPQTIFKWLHAGDPTEPQCLLAPIKSTAQTADPLYQYIHTVEQHQAMAEQKRLLYVATTRAKKTVQLFAQIDMSKTPIRPKKNSLLALLQAAMPTITPQAAPLPETEAEKAITAPPLARLEAHYFEHPHPSKATPLPASPSNLSITQPHFAAQATGTLIHQLLDLMAKHKITTQDQAQQFLRKQQQAYGIDDASETESHAHIQQAIHQIFTDPKAAWILSDTHTQAESEYALHYLKDNNTPATVILDRTFVDADNQRWIIDYKITEHINRAHYEAQLTHYAEIMHGMDPRPIQLGIYSPLSGDWVTWTYAPN
jgi:ATP-dependent exoDNAse (exonuclease V) beta subunit